MVACETCESILLRPFKIIFELICANLRACCSRINYYGPVLQRFVTARRSFPLRFGFLRQDISDFFQAGMNAF